LVMNLPASSSVTSWRPRGSGIGSSNRRFRPRSATGPPIVRHAFAPIELPIFLCGPSFLIPPRLIAGLGPLGRKHLPCPFEVGARLVKGGGGARCALARLRSRIETAAPAPWCLIVRDAGSNRDRADVHIAAIDQPAFFASVVVAAAGEDGHGEMIPPIGPEVKPLRLDAGRRFWDQVWGQWCGGTPSTCRETGKPVLRKYWK
jgi:hypothetical protein